MSLERDELEAAAASCRDVARVTKAQYDALLEAGFDEAKALRLTVAWLQASIGEARQSE